MRECIVCGSAGQIEKHHVFGGTANRKISEKNGFVVDLCSYHHRDSREGVHFNKDLAILLKQKFQKVYEQEHTREEFIKLIGRSYL
jgi:hypothetical protein